MNPPKPPPPSGWPAAPVPPPVPPAAAPPIPPPVPPPADTPARKTLLGGLPWEAAGPAAQPAATGGGPILIDQRPVESIDPAYDADPLSWRSLRARFDEFVRRSPPLTVSVSLHVIVLLLLTLAYVRRERPTPAVLDLSFASPVVDEEQKGVEIPPAPEPVQEPEMEQAVTDKPPVEDPVAAPPASTEVADAPGAADPAESAAPAIGTLLNGREEGRRQALVNAFGGSDATEAAVARALAWLVKQQGRDGLWSLQGPYADSGSQENRLAASAMALLAFQGAGNTPEVGRHRAVVARGWKALVAQQLPEGNFDLNPLPHHHTLYSHAQATIAACELYGMTKDAAHEMAARRAVSYALQAQGPDGGWRYGPGQPGDMSVTGWFMMALKSAEMAGIEVPPQTFRTIERFLDDVAVEGGVRYGYRREIGDRAPTQVTAAISAEGLLCRQYLGWRRDDPRLVEGLERLVGGNLFDFENDKDFYAWYYVTQVAHHAGGTAWDRWNAKLRAELPARQVQTGREAGSWEPGLDKWGHIAGRLYATCFCTWMLEVYYRHLPLYGGPH